MPREEHTYMKLAERLRAVEEGLANAHTRIDGLNAQFHEGGFIPGAVGAPVLMQPPIEEKVKLLLKPEDYERFRAAVRLNGPACITFLRATAGSSANAKLDPVLALASRTTPIDLYHWQRWLRAEERAG